jgi:transcriptional regulator with XRE-family HTH domain
MVARTSIIDLYLGKRLRIARITKNLNQSDLAKKIGITFQQIQKYEKGLNRISASRLYNFIKILGVNFEFFFDGIDSVMNQDDDQTQDIKKDYHSLNENEHNEINIDWDSKETIVLLRSYYSIKNKNARDKILDLIKVIDNQQHNNKDYTEE